MIFKVAAVRCARQAENGDELSRQWCSWENMEIITVVPSIGSFPAIRVMASVLRLPLCRHVSTSSTAVRRKEMYDRFLRVDHAGELGADRIYAGQMAVLGNTVSGPVIKDMWEQEKHHLRTFEEMIPRHRVRPTALLPFWEVAGFVLGASTALLGSKSAMACTVAVETVITDHYNDQIRELMADDPEVHKELLEVLKQFRDDEQHHHDLGIENLAEQAPFYSLLTSVIKTGCKAAIWVAERV